MKKQVIMMMIVLLCSTALLFSAPSSEQSSGGLAGTELVVLSWDTGNPDSSIVGYNLEEFTDQTGIKINHTSMGFADLHTRMATLFASRSQAVDVFAVWKGSIHRFAAPGYVHDITDELGSDYVGGLTAAIESFKFNNRIYGLPYMQSFKMFYYNKDLFEKAGFDPETPPATWDELLEIAKATTMDTNGDGDVDTWGLLPAGIGDADNSVQDFELLYYLCGGDSLFDVEGNPTFNGPEGKKALELYIELFNAEVVDPASWTIDSGNDRRARFVQGNTAMVFEWPSLWSYGNTSEASKIQGRMGIAPMPKVDRIAGIGGDEGLAISAYSNNKEAGIEFLKFNASEEINRENTLRVGWLPVQKSLMSNPEILNHPVLKDMIDVAAVQNQHYMDRFAAPFSGEVSNEALGVAIVDAVNGKRSVDDALAWAERVSREIVAKYK